MSEHCPLKFRHHKKNTNTNSQRVYDSENCRDIVLVNNILPEERCRRQFSKAYMAELAAMGPDIYHPIGPEIAMFRVFNTV